MHISSNANNELYNKTEKKRKATTKINTEINNFVQLYKNKNKGSKINT